ncbi:MAG: phosphoadenylyl-sulfate reductase [Flavobacteriales bacterium]|nr:phosphoadenylyl-sulfate reductase [Flavobacteriales bacterium]
MDHFISSLNTTFGDKTSVLTGLEYVVSAQPKPVTFSTSFSLEDQILTHIIFDNNLPIEVFTLDTGRLFPETYSTWSATLQKYKRAIKVYYPKTHALENYVEGHGPNAFYESLELRKTCCHIRKVEPLQRAIKDKGVWLTGIRAEHSQNRNQMSHAEFDTENQILKVHPLLLWSNEEVKTFINAHNIPYNPLHDRGFVSIGCAPCTRAIKEGEDIRAGRWWWEDNSKKECGLHNHNSPHNKS